MNVKGVFFQQVGCIYFHYVFFAYRQPHFCQEQCLCMCSLFGQLWILPHITTGTARLLTWRLGQREMRSCGEMVNVNLNRGGNVIISKSAEPSQLGGRAVNGHFTSRACQAERPGAWLPIPSGGFVSSSTKFSKYMQAQKGVENWGICLGDMVKVNERGRASEAPESSSSVHWNGPEQKEGSLLLNEMNTVRFTHCCGFTVPLLIPSQK